MRPLLLAILLLAAPKEPDVEVPGTFWRRLPPPREGEWRDVYREEGQTLADYRASGPVRPDGLRTRICLQPCLTRPPSDPEVLERLAAFLAASFGREVRTLEPLALPRAAYDPRRRQFDVRRLVPRLVEALPPDAIFLLAVTDRDLRLPRMSHAFGWGSFQLRVGIVSLRRLESGADEAGLRRRVLAVATHEAMHCLSMAHCVFYGCLMNGARTLAECDGRPLLLCPVCEAKLCWNVGGDAATRYEATARALDGLGLPAEAELARAAASATRGGTRP